MPNDIRDAMARKSYPSLKPRVPGPYGADALPPWQNAPAWGTAGKPGEDNPIESEGLGPIEDVPMIIGGGLMAKSLIGNVGKTMARMIGRTRPVLDAGGLPPMPPPGSDIPQDVLAREAMAKKMAASQQRNARVDQWLDLPELTEYSYPENPTDPIADPLPPKGGRAPWVKDEMARMMKSGKVSPENPIRGFFTGGEVDPATGIGYPLRHDVPGHIDARLGEDFVAGRPEMSSAEIVDPLTYQPLKGITDSAYAEEAAIGRGQARKSMGDKMWELDMAHRYPDRGILSPQLTNRPNEPTFVSRSPEMKAFIDEMRWKYGEGRRPALEKPATPEPSPGFRDAKSVSMKKKK